MNSWVRTESEDMLLALLSAALSNMTLLKTHFAFDRYVAQMLARFNLGASKVPLRYMCAGNCACSTHHDTCSITTLTFFWAAVRLGTDARQTAVHSDLMVV